MNYNQSEIEFEKQRLAETIELAKKQLKEAEEENEENKAAIIEAKKDMRENASHSISNLYSSDGFEALAEMSQYMNPVMDKIATFEEVENKKLILESLIKSPYFARFDFKFDGDQEYEKIYVGRASLKEKNSFDMLVYDWRSPIASVYYRFMTGEVYYDAPGGRITGEVNLKRQYEIHNGELEYFFESDVQIIDEFLRKLLSNNTSQKMKTIVETIQKEQDLVIRDMENELMMVQGVAGSGKTSIALHRAAYLMYQGLSTKLSANDILIISPNTLFEQYISNVLPELGESNVVSVVFEELVAKILHRRKGNIQSKNQFLEKLITSKRFKPVIKKSLELKMSPEFLEVLEDFISDIPMRWIDFEDIYYREKRAVKKEILRDKILGRVETPIGIKLQQLEDFIIEAVTIAKNQRLKKSEQFEIKEEIKKFTEMNTFELYKKFLKDKEYLDKLKKVEKFAPHIDEIANYTEENLEQFYLHYEDATVLAYLQLRLYGMNEYKNIKQVVIDEAQDYYPLQYEIFNLLFSNSKFTVLGDMNQTLEKQENIDLYTQINTILKKKKSSLITMDKSFRCTNEILKYSLKFIEERPEIKSFNRSGAEPTLQKANNSKKLVDNLVKEIKLCVKEGYQSIGLICKTEKNGRMLHELLKDILPVQLVRSESTLDLHNVSILPVYMSKGLEFDAVLICDASEKNYHSEDDKKLLYIACTRALHRLNLFCEGEESSLLES